ADQTLERVAPVPQARAGDEAPREDLGRARQLAEQRRRAVSAIVVREGRGVFERVCRRRFVAHPVPFESSIRPSGDYGVRPLSGLTVVRSPNTNANCSTPVPSSMW